MGAIENDGPYERIKMRIAPEEWTATIIWPTEVLTALRTAIEARTSDDTAAQVAAERALTTAVLYMIGDPPYGRWLR